MMDLALLSANANQLRYVLESQSRHPYYWFSFVSITISLVLQVRDKFKQIYSIYMKQLGIHCSLLIFLLQIGVGVGLILNSRYNVKNRDQICRADKINNYTVIGIFLITVVNVFVAAFGVADGVPPPGS